MAARSGRPGQILLSPIPNHGDNAGVAIYVGLERREGSMKTTILGLTLAVVITIPVAGQRTFVVDLNGGGDFTEIQAAIDAAGDGDTVLVHR